MLCSRDGTLYNSKMTWELYLYSLGYIEELNLYWRGQQDRISKSKDKDISFVRIDQQEKSIEIYYDKKLEERVDMFASDNPQANFGLEYELNQMAEMAAINKSGEM